MPKSESLRPFTLLDPQTFLELVEAGRKFNRVWADANSDLTHDLVTTFIGIESEADEVGKRDLEPREDEAHFYAHYYPYFIEARDETRQAMLG
jgi:hypothetical protein